MKSLKLFSGLAFSALALFLLFTAFSDLLVVSNVASLIGSTQNKQYTQCIASFSTSDSNSFVIENVHLNTDSTKDAIVQYKQGEFCGSAGCVTELCVSDSKGEYTHIPFGYAVKELTTAQTMNQGMHDLILNNDTETRMTWNGTSYELNQ